MEGHTKAVNSVSFSPDGQYMVSGSEDNTVRLWSVESCELLRTMKGHTSYVTSVAFSPDGGSVVSGSQDKTVRLWSVKSGELLRTIEGHTEWVSSASFSPDGQSVVSGSNDKTVRLWSMESDELLRMMEGHHYVVNSVSFSPDGKSVLSADYSKKRRVWDVTTGQCLHASTKRRPGRSEPLPEQYQTLFSSASSNNFSGRYQKTTKYATVMNLSSLTLEDTTVGLEKFQKVQVHDNGMMAVAIDGSIVHLLTLHFGSEIGSEKRREEFDAKREEARRKQKEARRR